jgi:uncharacterized protein YndB with AHSA1/START domain
MHSSAPAERLFALLSDAPGWPNWFSPARRAEWAAGEGRVRLVGLGPLVVREVVLEETPPTHHAYSIRSVIPVREHRADVMFQPDDTGTTTITWTASFRPALPGTGGLLRLGMRAAVSALARALVKAAELTGPGSAER